MKLPLALLALLHLSHALHINSETRSAASRQVQRTTQDPVWKDLDTPSTDSSNAQKPKKPKPWWKLPNTNNGEMNALTGQQFYPFDDDDDDDDYDEDSNSDTNISPGNKVCPINPCQRSGALVTEHCGPHSRCIRNHCQCDLGWKPASNVPMARGWSGLEALTVWADALAITAFEGCSVRCNSLSCAEVPQVAGCFDTPVRQDEHRVPVELGLATDGLHLGAIKAPGADPGIDYAAGVAGAGGV